MVTTKRVFSLLIEIAVWLFLFAIGVLLFNFISDRAITFILISGGIVLVLLIIGRVSIPMLWNRMKGRLGIK